MKPEQWDKILFESLSALWQKTATFAPRLIAALVVLVVGWILARVLRAAIERVLKRLRFDRLVSRVGLEEVLERVSPELSGSRVVARVIFWALLLVALLSAADVLGLEQVSESLDKVVDYLPNVLAAIALLVGGFALAGLAKKAVVGFLDGVGASSARVGGQMVYGVILLVAVGLSISQLQIETRLFELVAAVALAAIGLAGALAIGMGARRPVADVLSGLYARDQLASSTSVRLKGPSGETFVGVVREVGSTATLVTLEGGGELRIPNRKISEYEVVLDEKEARDA